MVECCVVNLFDKSHQMVGRLKHLMIVFNKLPYQPTKMWIRVTSGKFMGFIVCHQGIEADPTKLKAVTELPLPKNIRELEGSQGHLAYIRKFVLNLLANLSTDL